MQHSTTTPPQSSPAPAPAPAPANYWAARSPQMIGHRLPGHHARPMSHQMNFTGDSPGAGERGSIKPAFSEHRHRGASGNGTLTCTVSAAPQHRMNNYHHGTPGALPRAELASAAPHHHCFNNDHHGPLDSVPPMRQDSIMKVFHYNSGVDDDFVMPHVLAGLGNLSLTASPSTSTSTSATDFITNQAAGLRVTERIAEQGERQTVALERMFELSVLMTDTSKVDERTRAGIEAAKEMINRKHEAQRGV
ncbi:uncharacterized protein MELLADRAFT_105231 [Melampsora larici-populina 98AG31]|uniref:Uncharacterized protein n=1 Tax=Melampsora larici-populina (strain 98AG31 / pathotype 3-4-7) TaxID=747676 RepID=F4RHA1_MELLP|nr:uncharacterized protein MELLADRAFT_105231 [Melampsora larici-populina 98AG31]EGG08289.1 hypothetical protein MELLADRAFT_105231 [Melampsora larici-populina 98AG31]